jgi:myo-inositol-1(or 4)-monophosphatase
VSEPSVVETAIAAARAGGEVLLSNWRNLPPGSIAEKVLNDFVTTADRASENAIISRIREVFPRDNFLAEEGGRAGSGGDPGARTWVIDPLDGTSNFIAGFPFWCVSIGAREGSRMVAAVIWDPLRSDLYAAERGSGAWRNGERMRVTQRAGLRGSFLGTGFPFRSRDRIDLYLALFRAIFLEARAIRRAGSAALDLAAVAAGVFDGFFEFRLSIWDIAAGALLIQEAGGELTDFDGGERFWERGNVVGGNPAVARALREISGRLFKEEEI